MSYVISLTDGTIFAVIPEGTVNTESSMALIGQNYEDYGTFVDTNFIHLLENSSNTTSPPDPLTGQLWWDKTNKILKIYDGTGFKSLASSTASGSAPTGPALGDFWYDTAQQQVKVYTGDVSDPWLVVGPGYSTDTGLSGAIVETILDTNGITHVVVKLYTNGTVVGIVSQDAQFTPVNTISGFSSVKPGLQLASSIGNASPLFQGTATLAQNSELLNGLSSSQLIKKNVNETTTGSLTLLNNDGIVVGASQDFKLSVSNANVQLSNQITSGNIQIQVSPGGVLTTALTVTGGNAVVSFTNTPRAPTVDLTTNDTQLVTAEFVQGQKISPAFTGIPTAPTAANTVNTTQLATTAFVQNQKVSPAFTGVPTAPTASLGTNTTQLATTAFVQTAVGNIPVDQQLWEGSHKYISNTTPSVGDGSVGDFWFQV